METSQNYKHRRFSWIFEIMPKKRKKFGDVDNIDIGEGNEKLGEELEEESADERLQVKKILREIEQREHERREREKKKKRKSHMQRPKLPIGVVVNTAGNRYKILELLGTGGFGDVYKVHQMDGTGRIDDIFALKTETITLGKTLNRLKVEMTILQECENLPEEKRKHFVKMIDRGRTETFKFIVMQLVGASIDKLQKQQPKKHFTFSTTTKLGLQTLEGIGDLHDLGYLHRDVKPQNFTIGLKEKTNVIYLLDFGIARRYVEKDSRAIRLPRETVRFLGTVRFASRNCHYAREQCRRDDLESWIYMLLEFTEYASLPWSRVVDRDNVCKEKERLFAGIYTKHIASLPKEIHKILKYINELNFQDTPDYKYVAMMLKRAASRKRASITIKFDWEKSESERDAARKMPNHGDKNKIQNEKLESSKPTIHRRRLFNDSKKKVYDLEEQES
uniref:non-specific serine/threonine protein kinase n=1 Tax=Onchocerca volvulus TaxID=6282 RepID=A0A2K6WIL6_ONCVO